jgi:hypothetical protein
MPSYRFETAGVQDASWGREEAERAHQANPNWIISSSKVNSSPGIFDLSPEVADSLYKMIEGQLVWVGMVVSSGEGGGGTRASGNPEIYFF